jgi:hypothetical protein
MSVEFESPINLNQLELQNVQLQQLGSDPASSVEGQIWFRSDLHRARIDADSVAENVAWEKETTKESRSTGLFTWTGVKLVKVDATHVGIGPGTGHIVDTNGDHIDVTWVGNANLLDAYVGSTSNTFFMIDNTGAIVQQGTYPTPTQLRSYIYLGYSVHAPVGTISVVTADPNVAINEMSQVRDLLGALGLINRGVQVGPNGANITVNTSAGYLYNLGLGFATSTTDTSRVPISAQSPATFQYRTQTGASTGNLTNLEVGFYDNAGTRTSISGTRFSTQRVYVSPAGIIRFGYGQVIYNTMTSAVSGLATEVYTPYAPFTTNFALIGLITVKSSATSLLDSAQAVFHPVSIFGESISAGAGVSVVTLQQAYDNGSEPEILTSTTRGALNIQRGSAADTDTVLQIQNGAGANVASITGAGVITGSNLSGTNTGDQTNITGNAATVTTNANLTGVVTSVGNATAIADGALSIAKTSGLQTALDAKHDIQLGGSANLDSFSALGNKFYIGGDLGGGSWLNKPAGDNAAAFITMRTHPTNYYHQLYFNTNGNRILARSNYNGDIRAWKNLAYTDDTMTPAAHKASHSGGGSDAIDSLGAVTFTGDLTLSGTPRAISATAGQLKGSWGTATDGTYHILAVNSGCAFRSYATMYNYDVGGIYKNGSTDRVIIDPMQSGNASMKIDGNAVVTTNDSRLSDARSITDASAMAIKAGFNVTGGGAITRDAASGIKWAQRFIVIANGNGSTFSTDGYFSINMPGDGTVITGVGGSGNITVTGGYISLTAWSALYYILPIGSSNGTVNANFRVVSYTSSVSIPATWILVAVHNGEAGNDTITFCNRIQLSASQVSSETTNTAYLNANKETLNAKLTANTVEAGYTFGNYKIVPGGGATPSNGYDGIKVPGMNSITLMSKNVTSIDYGLYNSTTLKWMLNGSSADIVNTDYNFSAKNIAGMGQNGTYTQYATFGHKDYCFSGSNFGFMQDNTGEVEVGGNAIVLTAASGTALLMRSGGYARIIPSVFAQPNDIFEFSSSAGGVLAYAYDRPNSTWKNLQIAGAQLDFTAVGGGGQIVLGCNGQTTTVSQSVYGISFSRSIMPPGTGTGAIGTASIPFGTISSTAYYLTNTTSSTTHTIGAYNNTTGYMAWYAGVTIGAATASIVIKDDNQLSAMLSQGEVYLGYSNGTTNTRRIRVDGTGLSFFNNAPVARGSLAQPSGTITRTTFATSTVTTAQLAERVYAMINDLRLLGLFA